ncbi:retrovirus-related Pol polyprotein from transposon 17.6 [Trichonephila clavipes]|nr:retrovirus-related Pol polyprotein from transposon 17.6 [Trichonephila clavipes]
MKPKTYKIPENLKRKVDVQIDELLELGLIEPVVSEIAHPVQQTSNRLRTHRGQYQWNVLPFELRNAAATYPRAMSKVVQTISDFACAYIDDLAIFSDTWEEHLNHLEEVFKRLEHFNFSVNLGKSLCGITELQVPDLEKPYYLHTDASQTAVRCCLGQLNGEDNIHTIAFGSQELNPSQQKWSTIEREAYAIIWALKRFETLLCGAKIFLLTDNNPLVFLTSAAPQCPRLQRWALSIQRHNIEKQAT